MILKIIYSSVLPKYSLMTLKLTTCKLTITSVHEDLFKASLTLLEIVLTMIYSFGCQSVQVFPKATNWEGVHFH